MTSEEDVRRFLRTSAPSEDDVRAFLREPPKRSLLSRIGGVAGQLVAGPAKAVLSTAEGAANLVGADEFARRRREDMRLIDVALPARNTTEKVVGAASRILGEGAQFVVPGTILTKVPKIAALPRAARFATALAADAPIDAALGASSTSSTATALSEMTDAEWLDRIAADPKKRAAFEAVTGGTAAAALAGGFKLGAAGLRKAREAIDIGPAVDAGLREGVEGLSTPSAPARPAAGGVATEADVRALLKEIEPAQPVAEVATEELVAPTPPGAALEALPEPDLTPRRKVSKTDQGNKYGRAVAHAMREEAEIAGVVSPTRRKVDYADPDLTIGAIPTGAGVFAKGRRTQALKRAKTAKAALGGDVPDPDVAILDALEADPLLVPSRLAPEFANLPKMADDELTRLAGEAEDFAYRNQDNADAVTRRAMLAGEAKRRGLLEARPGAVTPRLAAQMGGAAIGGLTGAAADDENPLRGAVVGAGVGALGGTALKAARSAARPAYLSNPAVQSVLGTVSKGTVKQPLLKRLSASLSDAGGNLYRRLVDETQPLRDFGREVGGSETLSHTVSQSKGWRGGAQQRLTTEFRAVVEAAKGHEDGAVALAKAERALELDAHGMSDKGVDLAAAQQVVNTLGAVPEVRRAVDQLRAYYRSLLQYKLDSGVIDPQQFAEITAKGQAYVPFVRDFDQPPTAGGGKLVNRGTGVRRMTEEKASSKTVDPFEQAVLDTFEAHRTAAKQRVTNVVAGIVSTDPQAAAPFIRELPQGASARHGREVQANVGGARQRLEVLDEELYDAWAAFDNRTQNILVRVLQPFKRALQTTVTLMPDFAIRNMLRDNAQSAIQYGFPARSALGGTTGGAVVGAATDEDNRLGGALKGAGIGLGVGMLGPQAVRVGRAMGDIVGNAKIYDEWLREGGSGFSEFYAKPEDARRLIREMRKDRSLWDTVRAPIEGLQGFGRMIEEAPRLARYKAMRQQGAGVAESVASSRDISLDFANIGSDTKGLASVTAFFNAKVQGWDKLVRLLKNPKTWGVGAATLTAPSVALWAVNKDDPEYWERPQWERNLFWLLPNPAGGFFRIPKPFEVGFLFASLPERVLDFAYQRDPETLKHALGDMLKTTGEGTLPVPTALEPLVENAANYDFFTNRPVVSPGLERLPDPLQYDNRTSSVAMGLERAIPGQQSPQRIDNVLRGYTGNLGREVTDVTNKLARGAGLDSRPLSAQTRAPLVGSFLTRDDQISDAEMSVRRQFEEAERAYMGAKALMARGDTSAAETFVRDNLDLLSSYESLQERKRLLDGATEMRRAIQAAEMPDRQKREILARINRAVSDAMSKPEAAAATRR